MAFPNVFTPARIRAAPQSAGDSNAFLRSQREILLRIPAVSVAEITALFNDSLHGKSLASQGEIRKQEVVGKKLKS